MEAVGPLLRPVQTGELDLNANRLDAVLEVKKLQQLVWKLEWQNEQLRNRSVRFGGPSLLSEPVLSSPETPEDQLDYFMDQCGENTDEPSLLDELELLDLNSMSTEESDETW